MTEAEIHAAAISDPDAQSLTPERLAKMKQTPRVKIIRRAIGLSQEDFAEKCGIHRTYVGAVERGECNITLATLENIALALGEHPADLLSRALGRRKR